jgi:NAD(P)-dependent dehydrogenase (short-subunit alcohol dehydrogenase family)
MNKNLIKIKQYIIHKTMRFKDKVAIVTGGASGIGLATAKRFASEGAGIVLADINEERLKMVEPEILTAGAPRVLTIQCDVSKEDQVAATVKQSMEQFEKVDVIINNAGLMNFKLIEDQTGEDWLRILQVDLLGAFYFIKQGFKHMKPGSSIVNISSIHAVETEPMVAPYAAAKSALLSLTRSAAIEGKPKGIRVNAILPGAVDTPMLWDNPNIKSGVEKFDMTDVGKPEDLAATIAYLASDDAAFVQGAIVRVDGGRLNHL